MKSHLAEKLSGALFALAAVVMLGSCSDKKWHVEGSIAGADSKEVILEAPNGNGGWYPVDTVSTDTKGNFRIAGEPAGHPEIYRLSMGGESVYFPIDSLETVSLSANADAFSTSGKVSGSESADKLQSVNDLIDKTVREHGEQAVTYDPDLKRALAEAILRDPAGIVAYYTIFRRVGDTMIFNPDEKTDLRLIGAVANAFANERPADPRTKSLADFYISRRKSTGSFIPSDTIVATEIRIPEISLLDINGVRRSLSEVTSHGKVVVLCFTAYGAKESPAFNVQLARIYNELKPKGMEIYQVSVDDDEFLWREAAKNLPWITVYNTPKDGAETLVKYNVSAIPTLFVINRDGELVERVPDIASLASAVSRYL